VSSPQRSDVFHHDTSISRSRTRKRVAGKKLSVGAAEVSRFRGSAL
jgi:hypothetical protein